MLPRASAAGRIISRSSPTSLAAYAQFGGHLRQRVAQQLPDLRDGRVRQACSSPVVWPEACLIARQIAASSVGVRSRPRRMTSSEDSRVMRRRWISSSRSRSCSGSAGRFDAERPGVQRVEPGCQPGSELDRLDAERSGQRRVLVLDVAEDERLDAVGATAG